MTTNERNLKETNESEWRNEAKEAGLRLDNLIATAEGKPYAYILIAVEKDSENTNIGVQVNGIGLLLAQGLASFLAKEDYAPLIQMANYLAAMGLMDESIEVPNDDELSNEVTSFLRSVFGDK
jgi:hypothetical protein